MKFLNYVYKRLELFALVSYSSLTKRKESISIAMTVIKKKTVAVHLLFMLLLFWYYIIVFFTKMNNDAVINNIFGRFEIVDFFIAFIVFHLLSLLFIYIKRLSLLNKKYDNYSNIYRRELPCNLTPAHARLLVYDGQVDARTITSTILDLIKRGYLKLDFGNIEDIFKKEIYISTTDKDQSSLFDFEKYLMSWLFTNDRISSYELKNKLNKDVNSPIYNFCIFEGLVLLSFPFDIYYKKNKYYGNKKGYIIILFVCMFYFNNISNLSGIFYLFSMLLCIFIVCILSFSLPPYNLSKEGSRVLNDYKALKKYLIDFSNISEENSESIIIWDFYLPYSVALGINKTSNHEINSFFGNKIYDLNNANEENSDIFIDNVEEVIEKSKEIYQLR